MAELSSKTALGGQVGDTCRSAYLAKVFSDGSYGWLNGVVFEEVVNGQWLLDPNETNGWGEIGPNDNSNTFDIGSATTTVWHHLVGGYKYPYDVELLYMDIQHRNSSRIAHGWGWALGRVQKIIPGSDDSTVIVLHEVNENGGVGPRDYGNNENQETKLELSQLPNRVVPAGEVICLAVSSPTAVGANYYVQVPSGVIRMRRL